MHTKRLIWEKINNTCTFVQIQNKSGAVITCFYDLGLSRLGFEHPIFRLRGQSGTVNNEILHDAMYFSVAMVYRTKNKKF